MNIEEAIEKIQKYAKTIDNLKLENIKFNNTHEINVDDTICQVRELTWKEGLLIDFNCHLNINSEFIYNSEKEKRDILNLAILKVDGNDVSIDNLSHEFVEKLWKEYKKFLHLSNEEIKFLFNSAKKYFSIDENEYFPLHPLILEVDYMTKGIVTLSKTEFELLSMREFEAIQLILSAKNEI